MLIFKRILDMRQPPTASDERRVAVRHTIRRQFPLQGILNIIGRDDHGHLIKSKDGVGWDWPGRLLDFSATGARIQVPRTVQVLRNDAGLLKLKVQGYSLEVPCQIAHVAERSDSCIFGLKLDLSEAPVRAAYGQLVDLVAAGSSLKLTRPQARDRSGYLLEQYAGEPGTRLSLWRDGEDRKITAFEYLLKDCLVRFAEDDAELQCFHCADPENVTPAKPAQAREIRRLFQWVALNLAAVVPADARAYLLKHAVSSSQLDE